MSINQELLPIEEYLEWQLMKESVRHYNEVGCIHVAKERKPEKLIEFSQVLEKGRTIVASLGPRRASAELKLHESVKVKNFLQAPDLENSQPRSST